MKKSVKEITASYTSGTTRLQQPPTQLSKVPYRTHRLNKLIPTGKEKKDEEEEPRPGDIFDLLPSKCVKVRPIVGPLIIDGTRVVVDKTLRARQIKKLKGSSLPSSVTTAMNDAKCSILHPDIEDSAIIAKEALSTARIIGETRTIDVIARIRPRSSKEKKYKVIVWPLDEQTIVFDPKEKGEDFYFKGVKQNVRSNFGKKRPNRNLSFAFDRVYGPENSNRDIFQISLKDLIHQILNGFNCTVFAYGSTGSGKTYTMLGTHENPGITALMAEELYSKIEKISDEFDCSVEVSYLEVYNETIKDLIQPDKELFIREDGKKGIIIPDLTLHRPGGAKDLLYLLRLGNSNRSQHATDFNSESSRSHAVFQVNISLRQKFTSCRRLKVKCLSSKLVMVDLAGSEKSTANNLVVEQSLRQREGANINKSLLALSSCINALADGKVHIPYRNSKLTRLLKDSLSGNCVTVMIANLSPSDLSYEDTYNTLKYADRAKNITVRCKRNLFAEDLSEDALKSQLIELQSKVDQLSAKLMKAEGKEEEKILPPINEESVIDHCEITCGSQDSDFSDRGLPLGSSKKAWLESTQEVIRDPEAISKFLELLRQKRHLEKKLVKAATDAKNHEWKLNWKKVSIDVADFLGRVEINDPNFVNLAKLKNEYSALFSECFSISNGLSKAREELEDINREIELAHKTHKLHKTNEPWLPVTFQEFMQYKILEKEVDTLSETEKFHHEMSQKLVNKLAETELTLVHSMKLLKIYHRSIDWRNKCLDKNTEQLYNQIIAQGYGKSKFFKPPRGSFTKKTLLDSLDNLKSCFTRKLVDFPVEPIIDEDLNILKCQESLENQYKPLHHTSEISSTSIDITVSKKFTQLKSPPTPFKTKSDSVEEETEKSNKISMENPQDTELYDDAGEDCDDDQKDLQANSNTSSTTIVIHSCEASLSSDHPEYIPQIEENKNSLETEPGCVQETAKKSVSEIVLSHRNPKNEEGGYNSSSTYSVKENSPQATRRKSMPELELSLEEPDGLETYRKMETCDVDETNISSITEGPEKEVKTIFKMDYSGNKKALLEDAKGSIDLNKDMMDKENNNVEKEVASSSSVCSENPLKSSEALIKKFRKRNFESNNGLASGENRTKDKPTVSLLYGRNDKSNQENKTDTRVLKGVGITSSGEQPTNGKRSWKSRRSEHLIKSKLQKPSNFLGRTTLEGFSEGNDKKYFRRPPNQELSQGLNQKSRSQLGPNRRNMCHKKDSSLKNNDRISHIGDHVSEDSNRSGMSIK